MHFVLAILVASHRVAEEKGKVSMFDERETGDWIDTVAKPYPDAPQRAMTAAPQVHHAPLCAASGSKLKGMMRRAY